MKIKKSWVRRVTSICLCLWFPSIIWALGRKEHAQPSAKPADEVLSEKIVFEESFEGSLVGWTGRASETVSIKEGPAAEGKKYLEVSNRKSTWNGPIRDVSPVLKAGQSYRIGLWIKFDEGPAGQNFTISLERTLGGSKDYFNLGGGRVPKGEWTYLETSYTVPVTKAEVQYRLYVETPYKADEQATADDLISFALDAVQIVQLPPPRPPQVETDIPAFHTLFTNLPIGAAINSGDLDTSKIHYGLLRHFNAFVYENEMKQDALQPAEGRFVFDKADALVSFAQKQKIKLRGHTLLW
ncbi:MAG: carbohydrate binding domain-containing protein, partial [Treponemataceae bacterium]|nr:carbohydrate binding domain-containing protein [Treponemataceae bacterium]